MWLFFGFGNHEQVKVQSSLLKCFIGAPFDSLLGQKYLAASVDVCIFDIVKQLLNTHNCYMVMLED